MDFFQMCVTIYAKNFYLEWVMGYSLVIVDWVK